MKKILGLSLCLALFACCDHSNRDVKNMNDEINVGSGGGYTPEFDEETEVDSEENYFSDK